MNVLSKGGMKQVYANDDDEDDDEDDDDEDDDNKNSFWWQGAGLQSAREGYT